MKSFDNENDTFDLIDMLDPEDIEVAIPNIEYNSSTNNRLYNSEQIKDKAFKSAYRFDITSLFSICCMDIIHKST